MLDALSDTVSDGLLDALPNLMLGALLDALPTALLDAMWIATLDEMLEAVGVESVGRLYSRTASREKKHGSLVSCMLIVHFSIVLIEQSFNWNN